MSRDKEVARLRLLPENPKLNIMEINERLEYDIKTEKKLLQPKKVNGRHVSSKFCDRWVR